MSLESSRVRNTCLECRIHVYFFAESERLKGMVLSKVLVKLMKQKGLSFVSLARMSGVSKSTIHGWTTGRRVQDLAELKRIATVLEVPLHELIFGEADPFTEYPKEIVKELFSGDVRVIIQKIERAHPAGDSSG